MKKVIFTIFVLTFLAGLSLYSTEQKTVNEVEVKKIGGYWYAYMDFNGPYSLLGEKSKVFQEEFGKQGLKAAGPIFITFYNPPSVYKGYDLKWAVCFSVDKDVKPKEPIKKKFLTPIKSVVLMHTGPGDKIWDSFDKVQDYIKDHKFEKAWPAYEIYHKNPPGIEIIHPVK
jgi:effector-binding domain-containing protein